MSFPQLRRFMRSGRSLPTDADWIVIGRRADGSHLVLSGHETEELARSQAARFRTASLEGYTSFRVERCQSDRTRGGLASLPQSAHVLDALAGGDWLTVADVARRCGMTEDEARDMLRRLLSGRRVQSRKLTWNGQREYRKREHGTQGT